MDYLQCSLALAIISLWTSEIQGVAILCQVKDAIRSHRIAGAECNLLSNAGIFLKTAKSLSNSYGVAVIEKVQPGNYQVHASRIGYYTLSEYLTIAPDSDESKMIPLDLVISPKLSLRGNVDMYRIVMTWGRVPRDLDSFILTPWPTSDKCKVGKVFYNERKCMHGLESIGLDVDATDMYGPETITLRGVESGSFSYFVHIYTNGVCWDKIRANVKVYQASTGGLLYNIDQPKCSESGTGFSKYNCSRYWNVLTFDASTAKFKIHPGKFTNTAPTLKDHGLANPNCNCSSRAFINGSDVIDTATRLSEEAVKLNMEKLCIKEMETMYNNAAKKDIPLNPSESVAKLATFVSNRIEEKRRLALALKNVIKKQYEKHVRSTTSHPSSSDRNMKEIAQKQCCTYDGDKASYSTAYNKWVDMKSSCWSWPKEIKEMPHELVSVYDWTAPLEKEMISNFDTTSQKGELKWQYFTDDKTGFHRTFPAEVLGNAQCGTSDERLKSWYIEGVRRPKNIIILVDISYAMKEENKFMFVRTAIIKVLKGMLNNDFTNVIAFAEAALLPGMTHGGKSDDTYNSCLKSQLVQANKQNKKGLERFVQDVMLASEKTVNYHNAISTALKLVTNTNNNRETDLIFVTGSQDTSTESISELLKNAKTSISLHVYHLVGKANHSYIKDSRNKLAEMASVTNGKLETIYDYSNLAFIMGRFYKNMHSKQQQASGPYLSSPYFDERLGMYVILGVPCYTDNKELIGVVGIDITLDELLKNTVAFGPGELSYTFVIETDTGRTLVHPQLPLPGFVQNEPVVINIKYLEQSPGFSTVYSSMMRRETGTKILRSERVLSRGDPAFNGYRGVTSDFTYSWRPVNNTNFAVCVVVANDELNTKAMNIPEAYPKPDLYHRYDIVKHLKVGSIIEDKPIAFLNNITFPATLSRSNYFLSSSCFNDPYRFENTPETLEFVKELSDYVDGKRSVPPMQALKKEVLADIRLTREIEQCWNRNPMRVLGADAAWRYIATNSGAMRQYPGRQTYNNRYDPTTRPWYHAAKSYPGKLTFSVPYLDNGGAGVVVTTSQTISSDSMVRAVMGIDWKMKKINEIVTGSGAICQQASVACMLIDPNGYVVYSKQFISKPSIAKERVHLTYKHPELLRDLKKKGVISTSLACNDLELGQTYINYKITDNITSGKVEGATRCGTYIMVPVPNTNVYLIALDGGYCPDTTVKCRSCSKTSCADGITKDRSSTIPICVPCLCSVRYNPCALHYYQSPNAAVVCPSIRARNKVSTKKFCKKPDTDSTVLKGPKTEPNTAFPTPTGNGSVKGTAPSRQQSKVDVILTLLMLFSLLMIHH